jgi:hypothetical protein
MSLSPLPSPEPTIVLTASSLTPLALVFAAVGLPVAAAVGAAGVGLGVASKDFFRLSFFEGLFFLRIQF